MHATQSLYATQGLYESQSLWEAQSFNETQKSLWNPAQYNKFRHDINRM